MRSCKKCLFNEFNNPDLELDANGLCNMCLTNEQIIAQTTSMKNFKFLTEQLDTIKKSKKGTYDCLIGISGGVDSTYLVHLAKEWGLNPLLLHIDGGWNSDYASLNIKNLVQKSGFDYQTVVLPWEEIKDVQRAFVKSNVLDIDLPFDNAMLYYLYAVAKKNKIKYLLNGYNSATEGIMPNSYTHYKLDKSNILSIHKQFHATNVRGIKFLGTFDYLIFDRWYGIKFLKPLDWIHYNKKEAIAIVAQAYDWKDYGGKHHENFFTKFYQSYILPTKFGIDKRISHLSMLICSNQITKEEALKELTENPYYLNAEDLQKDIAYFSKKLGLTQIEFQQYVAKDPVSHRKYRSDLDFYDAILPIYRFIKNKLNVRFFD